jgi:hypothetical protein
MIAWMSVMSDSLGIIFTPSMGVSMSLRISPATLRMVLGEMFSCIDCENKIKVRPCFLQ